jgi:glutamate-5-semialdehyde dehydrogenase
MTTTATTARERMLLAKEASRKIGLLADAAKRDALEAIAQAIEESAEQIVAANVEDLARGRAGGLSIALQDRLRLDRSRVSSLASAVREVAALPDPVGRVIDERTLDSGVSLTKVAVPFGVVGSIYEARPNVTVDIAALALRSGNAVVLRGGSAAERTNAALVQSMRGALADRGIDPEAIQTVDPFGREGARELMQARGLVDVLVPRGSAQLIETVVTESSVPVIETGAGVVHIVLDESAPLEWGPRHRGQRQDTAPERVQLRRDGAGARERRAAAGPAHRRSAPGARRGHPRGRGCRRARVGHRPPRPTRTGPPST